MQKNILFTFSISVYFKWGRNVRLWNLDNGAYEEGFIRDSFKLFFKLLGIVKVWRLSKLKFLAIDFFFMAPWRFFFSFVRYYSVRNSTFTSKYRSIISYLKLFLIIQSYRSAIESNF